MSRKHVAVAGVYSTPAAAEVAIDVLRSIGFRDTDVSLLRPLGSESASGMETMGTMRGHAGAGDGHGLPPPGPAGWLAGLDRVAIRGAGLCMGAGPILGALAGVGVRGAPGTASDALVGLGLEDGPAKRYEAQLISGGTLLAAHADDDQWARAAYAVFQHTGGQDVSSTADISLVRKTPEPTAPIATRCVPG